MKVELQMVWDSLTKAGHIGCAITGGVPALPDLEAAHERTFNIGGLIEDPNYTGLKRELSMVVDGAREQVARFIKAGETIDEARILLDMPASCPVIPTPEKWLVLDLDGIVVGLHDLETDADKQIASSLVKLVKTPYWMPPAVQMGWVVSHELDGTNPVVWYVSRTDALAYTTWAHLNDAALYFATFMVVPEGLAQGPQPVPFMGWVVNNPEGAHVCWFEKQGDVPLYLAQYEDAADWVATYMTVPADLPQGELPPNVLRGWIVFNPEGEPVEWYDIKSRAEGAAAALTLPLDEPFTVHFGTIPDNLEKGTWTPPQAWIVYELVDDGFEREDCWFNQEANADTYLATKGESWGKRYGVIPEGLAHGIVPPPIPTSWNVYNQNGAWVQGYSTFAEARARLLEHFDANYWRWDIRPTFAPGVAIPQAEWHAVLGTQVEYFPTFLAARQYAQTTNPAGEWEYSVVFTVVEAD